MTKEIKKNIKDVENKLKDIMLADRDWLVYTENTDKHFYAFKENTIFPFTTNLIAFYLIEIDAQTTRIISRPLETKAYRTYQKVLEKITTAIFPN
ncbi:MAG: hypothetical protein J0M08_03325 [Bacteroidetes bacterium]|nr:hypothetical protein [Bacteroidota bacterium]